jgi:hypothetical protein
VGFAALAADAAWRVCLLAKPRIIASRRDCEMARSDRSHAFLLKRAGGIRAAPCYRDG